MADYASNKVPELKKMLVERGLSDKGNKAELVARLKENDEAGAGGEKADEITWTDDAPAAEAPAAAAPAPAEKPAEPVHTPAVASGAAPTDGALPEGAVAEAAAEAAAEGAEPAEPAAPAVSYAAGLNATTADEEAKRRAERAKRFGIEVEEDEEAKLKKERAKRFGIEEEGNNIVGGLDSALPERRERKPRAEGNSGRIEKRRGGGGGGRGGRDGRRQHGGRGDRRGGRDGGRRQGGGGEAGKKSGSGIFNDPAEKAKAEARAARFAAN